MVILDSTRLVIPTSSQKTVLTEIHRAHSGITKTYATATQLYYWPAMKNCIKTFLSRSTTCQKFSASQARTPVNGTAPSAAEFPLNNLDMDLFDTAGKKWLAVIRLCMAFSSEENHSCLYLADLGLSIHRLWISFC